MHGPKRKGGPQPLSLREQREIREAVLLLTQRILERAGIAA